MIILILPIFLIVIVIVIIMSISGAAGVVATGLVISHGSAKNKAKEMLKAGRCSPDVDKVLKTLSHIPNDLEAADLWKKLNELKK